MWATRRILCSIRIFLASRSPCAQRCRYICSSCTLKGLGKEPTFPARCKERHRLLFSSIIAVVSMVLPLSFHTMLNRTVPIPKGQPHLICAIEITKQKSNLPLSFRGNMVQSACPYHFAVPVFRLLRKGCLTYAESTHQ